MRHPNIIFITVDSLRADHLGCYGYSPAASPNLDLFARQSLLFKNAFSNGPNTPHAFPAIMAARSSLSSNKLGLFDAPITLTEVLKSAGYRTLGFNAANPYVSRFFQYDRGFDEFHDYLDFSIPTEGSSGNQNESIINIPALDLNRYLVSEEAIHATACLERKFNTDCFEAVQKVKAEPFFLWLHYMDTHYPYLPQMKHQQDLGIAPISNEENFSLNTKVRENMSLSPKDLARVIQLYDAAVRQLDFKLGQLFQFLKRIDLFEPALIVVTADHGEEFLEHGDLQHKSKLFDELVHVPLFIKPPGAQDSRNAGVWLENVSLMQLAPTILSTVKLEDPFEPSAFLNSESEPKSAAAAIFAEASYYHDNATPVDANLLNTDVLPKIYSCQQNHWKLIFDINKNKKILFNLIEDSRETRNVYQERKEKITQLEAALQDRICSLDKTRLKTRVANLRQKISPKFQSEYTS